MDVILDRGSTPLTSRKTKGSQREPFVFVIPLTGLDLFASDIETCKHVSASLGSVVIPLRGLTAAGIKCESTSGLSLDTLACHSRHRAGISITEMKSISA